MTAVDWDRWRKCMSCFAEIGEPCVDKLGAYSLEGRVVHVQIELSRPHSTRRPRTGGAR